MTKDDWFGLALVFGIMVLGVLLYLTIGSLHD